MCKLCKEKPVYEFTNKRKLCKKCFIEYFQKKVLYIIRKFNMIMPADIVGYRKGTNFREAVLKNILDFARERIDFEIVALPSKKTKKIASSSSLDSESEEILQTLIKGNASGLGKFLPVEGNIVKPLYLFLEEEILLYAKLKNIKYKKEKEKKNNIRSFEDNFEKKHPEAKRAIVNSILELYKE